MSEGLGRLEMSGRQCSRGWGGWAIVQKGKRGLAGDIWGELCLGEILKGVINFGVWMAIVYGEGWLSRGPLGLGLLSLGRRQLSRRRGLSGGEGPDT